jgi:chaperonin GroEL
LGVSIFAGTA